MFVTEKIPRPLHFVSIQRWISEQQECEYKQFEIKSLFPGFDFQGYQYTRSSLKRVRFKQVTNKLLQTMIY